MPFRGEGLIGTCSVVSANSPVAVILHGGGTSSAVGFQELRAFLHARQVATVAFDAIGHGCTGGAQLGTNLEDRVEQVVTVVRHLDLPTSATSLIGFSMGAYVAVKAASELGIPRLGLAIPAAYATRAYRVPFGPRFTEILRTPASWAHSDAFDLVAAYSGHLLVISADADQVVPPEIPAKYILVAKSSASKRHHIVRAAGHNLSEHYARVPDARDAAYAEIACLCQRGS
ncbi:alpha/beta fold hydrolase [Rhodoferax sp.]|uniref:alpha/beta hydrolase n=1 Tax=Rhodoferax sp. TaxID=50421 RepID=UPI00285126C6|nr:alpha/beta fold hydrolase [Rhodoferax sp.]MDR3369386.1 alpha/beta fold hydrolase [Rhodoferax sp.]